MVRTAAESGFFRASVTAVESGLFRGDYLSLSWRLSLILFLPTFALLFRCSISLDFYFVDCSAGNWDRTRGLWIYWQPSSPLGHAVG